MKFKDCLLRGKNRVELCNIVFIRNEFFGMLKWASSRGRRTRSHGGRQAPLTPPRDLDVLQHLRDAAAAFLKVLEQRLRRLIT